MSLAQRIETLRKRHAQLEHLLQVEEHRPMPDLVKVHQFKREKLALKDQMHELARTDDGEEIAQQSAG